ncbi:hypothetical protein EDC94DRAFT_585517 [Helicostylum pulchrum]|nr:hypothetical protein EDC94DRAFT_585517 [Helicostylum pulchrum]
MAASKIQIFSFNAKYDISSLSRLRYSTDTKADTFFQWEGSIFVFIPGEQPKKLFKCVGMNVSKAKVEEGKLKVTGRELTYYLDPATGEKLNTWNNPWTGENDLPVVHIANDPVQMAIPSFIPLETRENKFNNTTTIVSEIPLFYPNPLATEDHKFDEYDANKMYQAGEFFTFKCNTTELADTKTIDNVDVNWTRISKFPPFMKMGGKDGYLVYHCSGYKLPQTSTADDLDPLLAEEIKNRMTAYATAADEYDPDVKSVSSWTYFKDNFETYQKDPKAIWPLV